MNMKTSNKLLIAGFIIVVSLIVALNLMLKNEILTLRDAASTTKSTTIETL